MSKIQVTSLHPETGKKIAIKMETQFPEDALSVFADFIRLQFDLELSDLECIDIDRLEK